MGTSQIDKIFPLLMDTENIKKMQLSDLMRRLKAYPPQEFEFRLALEHTPFSTIISWENTSKDKSKT